MDDERARAEQLPEALVRAPAVAGEHVPALRAARRARPRRSRTPCRRPEGPLRLCFLRCGAKRRLPWTGRCSRAGGPVLARARRHRLVDAVDARAARRGLAVSAATGRRASGRTFCGGRPEGGPDVPPPAPRYEAIALVTARERDTRAKGAPRTCSRRDGLHIGSPPTGRNRAKRTSGRGPAGGDDGARPQPTCAATAGSSPSAMR